MFKVEFSESCCLKYFNKLPKNTKERILNFIEKRIAYSPYEAGEMLKGNLFGFWKSRIGDYRIIYKINDDKILVLIIKIGHRKEVYEKR